MIEGNKYIETVKSYFEFLIAEFGFKLSEEKISGHTFYDIKYKDNARVISISYENIEDYLLVIIFMLQDGELPDYDDKTKILLGQPNYCHSNRCELHRCLFQRYAKWTMHWQFDVPQMSGNVVRWVLQEGGGEKKPSDLGGWMVFVVSLVGLCYC